MPCMKWTRPLLIMLLTAPLFPAVVKAQRDTYAKYGLKTINTLEDYRKLIAKPELSTSARPKVSELARA